MEVGQVGDDVAIVNETAASLGDGGIEIIDGLEVSVGERFVDERPEMLGRLQFRGMGWLVDEPDAVGDGQVVRRMPACIVELEDDVPVASGADLACEGFEQFGEEGFANAVGNEPDGLPTRRRDEGRDVEPFVALYSGSCRP